MGTLASLAKLANLGTGCATKNLTRKWDDNGRICIISKVWHCMFQVVDN
jgi:hypothetical protein